MESAAVECQLEPATPVGKRHRPWDDICALVCICTPVANIAVVHMAALLCLIGTGQRHLMIVVQRSQDTECSLRRGNWTSTSRRVGALMIDWVLSIVVLSSFGMARSVALAGPEELVTHLNRSPSPPADTMTALCGTVTASAEFTKTK